jgi:hypothetical protein
MRTGFFGVAVFAGSALMLASPAFAALVVSKAATSNMTCISGTCTATAADAVLNVNDLKHLLAAGDVSVVSGSSAQDIVFDAKLQWTKPGRLTLDAYRGIAIGLDITSEGTGGVTLTTNDGGSGGDLVFTGKGKVSFWDTSSSLVINGTAYTLVDSVHALADAVAANPNGAFALSKFYDASVDGAYDGSPVRTAFGGTFEGLGHAVENLDIVPAGRSDYGFFADVAAGGTVRDLTFENPSLMGQKSSVGAVLAGDNEGTISRVSIVNVAGSGSAATVSGLVGRNDQGTIAWCSTSGSIAVDGRNAGAGGLAAYNSGTVLHAFSSVAVKAPVAGGLVAYNQGSVVLSSAAGEVDGTQPGKGEGYAAGLVADNEAGGTIDRSFATGAVSEGPGGQYVRLYAAGLATVAGGAIVDSYSTGNVTVGYRSFSGGFASSTSSDEASIETSYAAGANVKRGKPSFGFIRGGVSATDDYWDIDTSGTAEGCDHHCAGVTGLTTAQFQSGLPAGFDPAIWAESPGVNNGYPYLIANPPR